MTDVVAVRTWYAETRYAAHMPEQLAREMFTHRIVDQVTKQGYEPAPGAKPVIEHIAPAPWDDTVWGTDPDAGQWIRHPDDYGLRGTLRCIPTRG